MLSISGQDGRAGMVAIIPKTNHKVTTENLADLFHHCNQILPNYAIPRFVRIESEMYTNATFKQPKLDLVREGFDPSKVNKKSELYYADFPNKTYTRLTTDTYKALSHGSIRL